MFLTIFAMIVLWLIAVINSYTFGGFVHLLVPLALMMMVVRLAPRTRSAL